ncbi:MAG TPA: hypothetical protein VGW33_07975 [Terriglobia bacterium]|nr:hypothetical protein [Terriglobia bacterium]
MTGTSGTMYIANASGLNTFLNTVSQPITFDTTAAQTLQVTITFGAATTGNTSQLLILSVEEIN